MREPHGKQQVRTTIAPVLQTLFSRVAVVYSNIDRNLLRFRLGYLLSLVVQVSVHNFVTIIFIYF